VPSGVISADYFAVFCERIGELVRDEYRPLRAEFGAPPFVGIMSNGTSGDVNNVNFRVKRAPQPPFQQMRTVANAVAAAVYRAYQTIEHRDWLPLDSAYEEVAMASRRPTPEMITRARSLLAATGASPAWHSREKDYARRVLQRAEAPETVPVALQVLRIGEVAVMSLPVETFAEMGLELKASSPFPKAFTVSMANGYYGYLPTVAQHRLGGYESWVGTNRLEVEAAPKITATLLRLAADLKQRAD
jgi:hypothetical protein